MYGMSDIGVKDNIDSIKLGLIPNTPGFKPFWTNESNPRTISLNRSQHEIVTFWVNATGPAKNYTFFVYVNQTADQSISNITTEWNVTIPYPVITIIAPSNDSTLNTSSVTFNVSIDTEASWCGLSISGNANQTMTLNSSLRGANYTNSSIADGTYHFIVSCNDTASNFARSETYNFTVDTTVPTLTLNHPENNSNWPSAIPFNLSATDANKVSVFVDLDDSLVSWWRMDEAGTCYQESANVSTACGGLDTGKYAFTGTWQNPSNFIDGDWDTYGAPGGTGPVVYVNYTIPSGITNLSLLQLKVRNASGSDDIFNYSIKAYIT